MDTGYGAYDRMGIYAADEVTADPLTDLLEYKRQVVNASLLLIEEDFRECERLLRTACSWRVCEPTSRLWGPLTIEAGREIGFYSLAGLSRNLDNVLFDLNRAKRLEAEGEVERLQRVLSSGGLFPLVSDAAGNYGRFDQFTFFLGDDTTAIFMEDWPMSGVSDFDMTDLVLTIDARSDSCRGRSRTGRRRGWRIGGLALILDGGGPDFAGGDYTGEACLPTTPRRLPIALPPRRLGGSLLGDRRA